MKRKECVKQHDCIERRGSEGPVISTGFLADYMKLGEYTYEVTKYYNANGGISIYKLTTDAAEATFTVLDEGTENVSFGVASFKLKHHFLKGWILEGLCPYEFMEDLCHEHSAEAIAAIQEADKVVEGLLAFKMLIKNAPERIKVDKYEYPPEKRK